MIELESQVIQRCVEIGTITDCWLMSELILVNSLIAVSALEYVHILRPSNSIPEYISCGNFHAETHMCIQMFFAKLWMMENQGN